MSKRVTGLDLIRCLAFLLVVIYHSFLFNGFLSEKQTGVFMWLADSARWISTACIGLFLMLSGYLKGENTNVRSCWRSLIPVFVTYLLALIITVPTRHFLLGEPKTIHGWLQSILRNEAIYYGWYVYMFFGLTLLTPFVNLLLQQLKQTKQLLILAGVLLFMTAVPDALPWKLFPDFWVTFYPVTFYVLGATIRRLQPKIPAWLGLGTAAALGLLLGAATLLSTNGSSYDTYVGSFSDLWVTVIALCLFVALYRVQLPAGLSRVAKLAASGCFGGYLLSYLLDTYFYKQVIFWRRPSRYVLIFVCVTLPIYVMSILLGIGLDKITAWILKLMKSKKLQKT